MYFVEQDTTGDNGGSFFGKLGDILQEQAGSVVEAYGQSAVNNILGNSADPAAHPRIDVVTEADGSTAAPATKRDGLMTALVVGGFALGALGVGMGIAKLVGGKK